ncbi:MAG: hypothetical protein V4819_09235 [Verrucomicrobiota bacterium]
MDEIPETPEPIPTIDKGPLWWALAIPPLVTLVINIALGLSSGIGDVAGFSLLIPPVMFFVILGLSFRFHGIVKPRYRGRSLVFLNSAYFLGQIIVCLALWIGSCALVFPPLNIH